MLQCSEAHTPHHGVFDLVCGYMHNPLMCREVGTHFYFLMGELFGGITRIRSTVVMPPAAPDAPGGGAAETSAVAQFTTKAGVPGTLDLLTGVAGNEQVICRVYVPSEVAWVGGGREWGGVCDGTAR